MAVRVRRASIVIALLVATGVLFAPVANAATRQAPATLPTIYVKYTMDCTFSIFDDDGRRVTSIPPGTYQVEVSTPIMFKLVRPGGVEVDNIAPDDYTGCKGWVQFHLTGPGVDLFTTLDTGCDAFLVLPAQNFRAGSTYTAQDLTRPALTRTVFSVEAAGGPKAPSTVYNNVTGPGQTFAEQIGSEVAKLLKHTLTGTLTADGKLALVRKNGGTTNLNPARYRFMVTDKDPKHGVNLRAPNGKVTSLTGVKYTGRKATAIWLKPGDWTFYSGGKSFRITVHK
jgi:hypothetical protein